jgi:hypothetical protein
MTILKLNKVLELVLSYYLFPYRGNRGVILVDLVLPWSFYRRNYNRDAIATGGWPRARFSKLRRAWISV